jgi:hypothetical protein
MENGEWRMMGRTPKSPEGDFGRRYGSALLRAACRLESYKQDATDGTEVPFRGFSTLFVNLVYFLAEYYPRMSRITRIYLYLFVTFVTFVDKKMCFRLVRLRGQRMENGYS